MPIVLNSKTYNYDGQDSSGVSLYTERSAGVATGFSPLSFSQSRTDLYVKANVRLSVPIVATENSACSCIGTSLRTYRLRLELEEPVTGVLAERSDVLARIQGLVASPEFEAMIKNMVKPAA